ncbi:P-loop containing nucleoside triphosphate hydrolase protein [Dacryopinax primogenitus]|uniref:p-loop containing nucleoside triphosphate hydrolase protein n=1 Tax=Dacryopinax primogenitus (strain DJM 731) TaxID=1858805 RepID=M5GB65_DACPD|nr:P-loop containing nucleoside triphosphate hydrolase protein [Dacryopinax primogenitus]EJU03262.1 P-loop containing nucleoside triphosphate hydrolase protein [Dacryopinax primogenitus]
MTAYAVLLSASCLILQAAFRKIPWMTSNGYSAAADRQSRHALFSDFMCNRGGRIVYAFQIARFVGTVGLLILSTVRLALDIYHSDTTTLHRQLDFQQRIDALNIINYSYISVLCAVALVLRSETAQLITANAAVVSLIQLYVFGWRNIWPLMIFGGMPSDAHYPGLCWTEAGLLAVVAVIIPLFIPTPYIPEDPKVSISILPPEQTASLAGINLFYFLEPFVFRSYFDEQLHHDSLPPLADYDQSTTLEAHGRDILDPWRRRELGLKDRHLFFGIMQFFGTRIFLQVFIVTINVLATFLGPIAINRLLRYLETGGENAIVRPWVWILLIFISRMLFSLGENGYLYVTNRIFVHTENLLLQLIFAQSLRMRVCIPAPSDDIPSSNGPSASESTLSSDEDKRKDAGVVNVNTLIGADIPAILDGREFVFFFLQLPLELISSIWFLTTVLGWSAIIGMIFLVTDGRVKAVTECRTGRSSKNVILMKSQMFGWESMVKERIQNTRKEELRFTRKRRLLELVIGNTNILLPVSSMLITYGVYFGLLSIRVFTNRMAASLVFSSMSIFDLLRMDLVAITRDLNDMINAKVSLDRVDTFLRRTPLLDAYEADPCTLQDSRQLVLDESTHGDVIGFHDASFAWNRRTDAVNTRNFCLNFEGKLLFKRGGLNLIIGPTGSGKTSVLMALLREMHFEPMTPNGWYSLPRHAGIAYAVQESWVMNETIKENILFGSTYDEHRYNSVLEQCAVRPDLALFAAGDNTEVGEKGITLSGGQKARITLARALYSSAETILLDDVLSALDVHTSRWIVEKCLRGDLIQNRTVLLVTHAISLVGPIADTILELDSSGHIKYHGPPGPELLESLRTEENPCGAEEGEIKGTVHDALDEKPDAPKADGKIIIDEERAQGRLKWAAIHLMLHAYGGLGFWILLIAVFFIAVLMDILATWWLGIWTSSYQTHSTTLTTAGYLAIFIAFSFSQTALTTLGNITYIYRSMAACQRVHELLLDSIMSSTLRWLDTTPRGRIISRFTQDVRDMDGPLTQFFGVFITRTILLLLRFSAVMMGSPILLIPGLFVTIAGYSIGQVYLFVQMGVKRIRSNWKSPIYNHFSAAVAGIVSIRAYGAQDAFKAELFNRLDAYSRSSRCFQNLHRWIASRVDTLGALFATGVAAYLVYFKSEEAGKTGVRATMLPVHNGLISCFRSLERMRDYIDIDHESGSSEMGKPPAYWPASGALRAENLSAKYSEDSPLVLDNLSFEIKTGERIGIVGRTGSGKSTLALSLLRMIPTKGEVYLDGLPTSTINLNALRANLTIIPQEPVLVSGTIRTNLDPFGQQDDAVLNDALRDIGLLDRDVSLDTAVSDAGGNFSVGERQLVALARAIVRNTRILLLDEATASVDHDTDSIIQESIRRELKGATLLTIAHRLRTIMDYDKIMVLDAGKLIEFDTPTALLKKKDGLFKSLVERSGDRDELQEIARQHSV